MEEREYNEGRQDLHRGLTSAQSEAGLLRAELAEVRAHSMRQLPSDTFSGNSVGKQTRIKAPLLRSLANRGLYEAFVIFWTISKHQITKSDSEVVLL